MTRALLWTLAATMAATGFGLAGCSREYYREQADLEARCLVAEKSNDPRWALPNFTIEMDPRSRYYDVYDPDEPPMPPDDPASHVFMHCVDGMHGYKKWHQYGDITELENPYWRAALNEYTKQTPDGEIILNLEDAVQLALIHSPNYQQQLETIYLSALDVSTERFRFDSQFFGGNGTTFFHSGEEASAFGETNTLTTTTDFQIRRRFATAGELLVGFANSFVWQFAGPDQSSTLSILNFNLVQPLLRAGGRVIALEQLTIAERGLLANLRAFQRYRQGFYTQIAIGDSGVAGPQRRGGFFGGTGLTGFTGQGGGGFGGVGEATGFGRSGFGGGGADGGGGGGTQGFVGGGAGQVGGFIGMLQQLQQIRNTERSLNAQLQTLALLEAHLDAGLIDIAQVDQFRQNIESERASLLQARNNLTNSLENFKTGNLGLPPDLSMVLDDSLIRQFQLSDPRLIATQDDLNQFIDAFGELPREPEIEAILAGIQRMAELRNEVAELIELVESDLATLETRAASRVRSMTETERSLFQTDKERLATNLAALEQRFEATAAALERLRNGLTPENRAQTADGLVALNVEISNLVNELALIQVRARLEGILLEPVQLDPDVALEIARANRLDWMNNRAALVDTWRLIEFNANALQSRLDIVLSGDVSTLGDNPVAFRGQTGTLEASLRFDAPLTRLIERNNFRQQLITYQQSRRQLIQFEDGINRNLRQILREMEQLRINLEIQRRAVAIAIRRVDQTRENLARPTPPPQPGEPPAQFGPTAALNLLTALSDLRSSQNNFMSVWLNYEAGRLRLLRELGVMRIDENGLLIDEPLDWIERVPAEDAVLPPAVPQQWFRQLDQIGPDDAPVMPPPPASPESAKTGSPPLIFENKPSQVAERLPRRKQRG